jgi:uncharacterized protein YfdQ (DUF2303 family)
MSLDRPALELLIQNAIGQERTRETTLGGTSTIALPKDHALVDLEAYLPKRRRFRGVLKTNSIADFISYTKDRHVEVNDDSIFWPGFINADALCAAMFFNLGKISDPGHADFRAELTLKHTAAYAALLKADGVRFDQRGFIDFIEDWAPQLQAYGSNPDDLKPLSAALAAIRVVSITKKSNIDSTTEDFGAKRSTFDRIEATSRGNALPGGFLFNCEPALGLPARTFQLRLAMLSGDDKLPPALSLRIQCKEAQQEAIAQDFKRVLLTELETVAQLTIGTFTP